MGRNHYTVDQKLRAVEFAEHHGNTAAGRAFGLDESLIRGWRQRKDDLAKLPPNRSTLRHGTVKNPALEQQLKEWVVTQNQKGRPVTVVSLRFRAQALAKQSSIQFNAGTSWAQRFLRRSGLQMRKTNKGLDTIDEAPTIVSPEPPPIRSECTSSPSDQQSLSNGCVDASANVNSRFDLHSKFRKCEQRILGVASDVATAEPVDARDSRLDALEALVASLRERLDRIDPAGARNGADLEGTVTRLRRENVELQNRLRSYEQQRGKSKRGDSKNVTGKRVQRGKRKLLSNKVKEIKSKGAVGTTITRSQRQTRKLDSSSHPTGFNCQVCEQRFESQSHLNAHISGVHGTGMEYTCSVCQQQFTLQVALQRHLKLEHPSNSYDEEAGAASGSDTLDVAVTLNDTFQCPFCSEAFVRRGSLQNHLRKCQQRQTDRMDSASLLCPGCGNTFANSLTLRRHTSKCSSSAERQVAALHVECEVGDAEEPTDGSETDRYRELADLLEPGVEIIDQDMSDGDASTLVVQLNRFAEPLREIPVKLEPPEMCQTDC